MEQVLRGSSVCDIKKIDLDAYINGTPHFWLKRKKFYVVRIGNKTKQSPNKIEKQMGQDV